MMSGACYGTSADTGSSGTAAGFHARIAAVTASPKRTSATAPCTAPIAGKICDSVPRAIWTIVPTKTITAHLTPRGILAKNETMSNASYISKTA